MEVMTDVPPPPPPSPPPSPPPPPPSSSPPASPTASSSSSFSSFSSSSSSSTSLDEKGHIPTYKVPVDDDGFLQSFDLKQEKEIKEFFNKFGFVVINGILTPEECKLTIDDIWQAIEERWLEIKRSDPSTWENKYWAKTGIIEEGLVGGGPLWTQQGFVNRANPKLLKAWSILLGREDLLINHDRYGLFRPTKEVEIRGKKSVKPTWATRENLHLDMNPWLYTERSHDKADQEVLNSLRYEDEGDFIVENNYVPISSFAMQGLINLAENKEEDGGFQIVPGFKEHLKDWTVSKQGKMMRRKYGLQETFVVLDDEDPLHEQSVRVTCRAGSIVIWDQRTAHGSRPNSSERIRYAQFFKMFPATPIHPARQKARIASLKDKLEEYSLDISKIPKDCLKVLGLVPWTETQTES